MRVMYASLVFTLLCILIFISKPTFMFDANGHILEFGTETVFSVGGVLVVLAIMSFYTFAMLEFVYAPNMCAIKVI